jgi:hypothetical protein
MKKHWCDGDGTGYWLFSPFGCDEQVARPKHHRSRRSSRHAVPRLDEVERDGADVPSVEVHHSDRPAVLQHVQQSALLVNGEV